MLNVDLVYFINYKKNHLKNGHEMKLFWRTAADEGWSHLKSTPRGGLSAPVGSVETRGPSLKLIWPPMEAASMCEVFTAVSRYSLKVTSLLILGGGGYEWGRCHLSLESQHKGRCCPTHSLKLIVLLCRRFSLLQKQVAVLMRCGDQKGVWFIFHSKKMDASLCNIPPYGDI